MKVFIKILPIKGKIKKGDWTQQTIKTYPIHNFGIWRDNNSPKNTEYVKFEKAKPFATILDIEVGDEVKGNWKGYKKVMEINKGKILLACLDANDDLFDDRWHKLGELPPGNFKILGEVSPNATFVEDGKEYEVRLLPKYKGDKDFVYLGSRQNLSNIVDGIGIEKKIAIVKCPCCGDFK